MDVGIENDTTQFAVPRAGELYIETGEELARVRHRPRLEVLQEYAANYAMVGVLVLLCILFSFLAPATFATFGNFSVIVSSQVVVLVLALALTLPLRAGDFDLSVSAVMTLASVVAGGLMTHAGIAVWLAILAALATGALVGTVNAILIVGARLDAFTVTLGMMTLVAGIGYALSGSQVFVVNHADAILTLSQYPIFGLPAAAYFGWLLAILFWYLFRYLPFGRHLLIVGNEPETAFLMGISVHRIRMIAFVTPPVLGAFAGILLIGQLGAVDPGVGPQYLLPPYTAVFLGMTTVQLGRVNIVGTVVALYLVAVGSAGLQLVGAFSWVQDVFYGGALILAVLFAGFIRARSSSG